MRPDRSELSYRINLSDRARKQLLRFDPIVYHQIIKALEQLATLENPRNRGKPLTGNLKNFWRYRAGDYRILAEILDTELLILLSRYPTEGMYTVRHEASVMTPSASSLPFYHATLFASKRQRWSRTAVDSGLYQASSGGSTKSWTIVPSFRAYEAFAGAAIHVPLTAAWP